MEFVYGSAERIFVNTSIGCNAKCSYCYLPKLKNTEKILDISAGDAIQQVENFSGFKAGEDGTIISIGCYSECLDETNFEKTKQILEYFLPLGNYIQLATKQYLTHKFVEMICQKRCFKQQISIYISMPTISKIEKIEKGTAAYEERKNNIGLCVENNINVVLYIKPFLKKTTSLDTKLYINLLEKYKIPVVVGPYLMTNRINEAVDVGENKLFEKEMGSEYNQFIKNIEKITSVSKHSTELITRYRESRRKNG